MRLLKRKTTTSVPKAFAFRETCDHELNCPFISWIILKESRCKMSGLTKTRRQMLYKLGGFEPCEISLLQWFNRTNSHPIREDH